MTIGPAAAQSEPYPSRPVQIIVPYAAGGTTDILAHIAGQALTELLGKSFVIVNKPGAGGSLGSEFAAKQPADGYTLVMVVESSHAVNPNVYEQRRYDPVKDFSPISNIADVPNVLVVNKDFSAKTLPDLIAELKKNPDKHTFGRPGPGA